MHTLEISCQFILRGNEKLISQAYSHENWKLRHIEDTVKEAGKKIEFLPVPSFIIFLDPYLRVIPESVRLKIQGKPAPIFLNDTTEFVGLPDCYPPLTDNEKPKTEKYSYLAGKASVFYTPFEFEKAYTLTFELEAVNFFYETGFLFPYRFVSIKNFNMEADEPIKLAVRGMRLVGAYRADFFPLKQEYEFLKHKSSPGDLMRPWVTPAHPFRNQPLIGNFQAQRAVPQGKPLDLLIENYAALQSKIWFSIPKHKEIITRVQITNSSLPVRIYEQLQKLPKYRDFLISFDLLNLGKEPQELEVISEINGYTDKAIDTVEIPPYEAGRSSSRVPRIILNQCPRLKRGMLEKVIRPIPATLTYKIIKKNKGKRVIYEQNTATVNLLPKDQIIWIVDDFKSGSKYDLSKMLGSWIGPTDTKGLLDKIRGRAKKYHPKGVLIGEQGDTSLEDKTLQVKALYDCLNKESGIGYVNQPFYFGTPGQRVLTAEEVISSKAGNCIDLVILFASLMEGLGINPLILLMPEHAFIGWGNKYKTSEMSFLECTTLGRVNPETNKKYAFEESFEIAKKTYKEKFLFIGSEDYLPIRSVFHGSERGYIVDLAEVRKEGIFRSG